ncbi:MAG TPA: DNA repair exonuclease [Polyangiaceae bacterium]|nr:DNA repair exonuclease [Polyangiaceae bacterium]
MKLVHAADLHLDSPLRGLPSYEGAPLHDVRSATRRALVGLVDLCLEQDARLLLLAGDLYDGDFRDYGTALFLVEQLQRLRETSCRVVWLRGNHDAQSQITRHLRLPAHVRELATEAPETVSFEELGLSVHGQGYATRELRENLARLYPPAVDGHFNIGLLHTALDGTRGHDPYAPCSVSDLVARGYDYWALGHVHRHEVIEAGTTIAYPGNLQGRHARETGPKGAILLELEGNRIRSLQHRALDVVRWAVIRVDARQASSFVDALEACRGAMTACREATGATTLACRMVVDAGPRLQAELTGRFEELQAELRRQSIELGAYLERVETRGAARLVGGMDQGTATGAAEEADLEPIASSPLGRELLGSARRLAAESAELAEWKKTLCSQLGGVAAELLRDEDFAEVLAEATELLESRLSGGVEEDELA